MKRFLLFIILVILLNTEMHAKFNYKQFWRDITGRKNYNSQKYKEAEKSFRENAIENPSEGKFHYNRGTALYKNEQYDEAEYEFIRSLNDKNFLEVDRIYHNLGNIAFNNEDYSKALELYRKALIENPDNIDTRKNYEMTKLFMIQEESSSDNKDNENDENDDNEEEQQQQNNDEKNEEQKEAERILQALEQKQEQERDKKEEHGMGRKTGNFW